MSEPLETIALFSLDDFDGGYQCGRCGTKKLSYMGHLTSVHYTGKGMAKVASHFCCPDDCELEKTTKEIPVVTETN